LPACDRNRRGIDSMIIAFCVSGIRIRNENTRVRDINASRRCPARGNGNKNLGLRKEICPQVKRAASSVLNSTRRNALKTSEMPDFSARVPIVCASFQLPRLFLKTWSFPRSKARPALSSFIPRSNCASDVSPLMSDDQKVST